MVVSHHITKLLADPRGAGRRFCEDEIAGLVLAASAGDRRAWDALVREFDGLISAVARGHRLCDADAADVAQATWLKLCEHLSRLNEPARVGAWLATTARRECLRVLRTRDRQVLLGEDAPERESSDAPPDATVLNLERDAALWRSFACLRARDQVLLRLLVVEPSPPYAEISAVLDMPIGSIGPTRQRALERLRRELQRQGTLTIVNA
jgi:RNA polymerase sigma factor (sigma-70 family)